MIWILFQEPTPKYSDQTGRNLKAPHIRDIKGQSLSGVFHPPLQHVLVYRALQHVLVYRALQHVLVYQARFSWVSLIWACSSSIGRVHFLYCMVWLILFHLLMRYFWHPHTLAVFSSKENKNGHHINKGPLNTFRVRK